MKLRSYTIAYREHDIFQYATSKKDAADKFRKKNNIPATEPIQVFSGIAVRRVKP